MLPFLASGAAAAVATADNPPAVDGTATPCVFAADVAFGVVVAEETTLLLLVFRLLRPSAPDFGSPVQAKGKEELRE